MSVTVFCPYCGSNAAFFATSEDFYRGRDMGPLWACEKCDARVGAHRDSLLPLGRLANKELRSLKIRVHALFDPLWRDLRAGYPEANGMLPRRVHSIARGRAYAWLAAEMQIPIGSCHIAMFDVHQCLSAIALLDHWRGDSGDMRRWYKQTHPEVTA